jgi:hypothetical protein
LAYAEQACSSEVEFPPLQCKSIGDAIVRDSATAPDVLIPNLLYEKCTRSHENDAATDSAFDIGAYERVE